jgi:hypothetical protein
MTYKIDPSLLRLGIYLSHTNNFCTDNKQLIKNKHWFFFFEDFKKSLYFFFQKFSKKKKLLKFRSSKKRVQKLLELKEKEKKKFMKKKGRSNKYSEYSRKIYFYHRRKYQQILQKKKRGRKKKKELAISQNLKNLKILASVLDITFFTKTEIIDVHFLKPVVFPVGIPKFSPFILPSSDFFFFKNSLLTYKQKKKTYETITQYKVLKKTTYHYTIYVSVLLSIKNTLTFVFQDNEREVFKNYYIRECTILLKKKFPENFCQQNNIKIDICIFLYFSETPYTFAKSQLRQMQIDFTSKKPKKLNEILQNAFERYEELDKETDDLLGMKVKITGRLNGADRAKSMYREKGHLAIRTYKSRIDYTSGFAKTKEGVLGIKIWIDKGFSDTFRILSGLQKEMDDEFVQFFQKKDKDKDFTKEKEKDSNLYFLDI